LGYEDIRGVESTPNGPLAGRREFSRVGLSSGRWRGGGAPFRVRNQTATHPFPTFITKNRKWTGRNAVHKSKSSVPCERLRQGQATPSRTPWRKKWTGFKSSTTGGGPRLLGVACAKGVTDSGHKNFPAWGIYPSVIEKARLIPSRRSGEGHLRRKAPLRQKKSLRTPTRFNRLCSWDQWENGHSNLSLDKNKLGGVEHCPLGRK